MEGPLVGVLLYSSGVRERTFSHDFLTPSALRVSAHPRLASFPGRCFSALLKTEASQRPPTSYVVLAECWSSEEERSELCRLHNFSILCPLITLQQFIYTHAQ